MSDEVRCGNSCCIFGGRVNIIECMTGKDGSIMGVPMDTQSRVIIILHSMLDSISHTRVFAASR